MARSSSRSDKPGLHFPILPVLVLALALAASGCSLFQAKGPAIQQGGLDPDNYQNVTFPDADHKLPAHEARQALVRLEPGTRPEEVAEAVGARVVQVIGELDVALLDWPDERQVVDTLRQLQSLQGVRYADPNYRYQIIPPIHDGEPLSPLEPGDSTPRPMSHGEVGVFAQEGPYVHPRQWGLVKIGAPAAWSIATGDGIVIAIVDSGIDPGHPDLQGQIIAGINTLPGEEPGDWIDRNGHGTHVASIAAGAGTPGGMAGVAPRSRLLAIKAMGDDGTGTQLSLALGIVTVTQWREQTNYPVIINMSLGSLAYPRVLQDAVWYAVSQGIPVIAAMGNDGHDLRQYPAALPGVIAVGATEPNDRLAPFSTTGRHISVVAPGSYIYSAGPGHSYVTASGTSAAAPHVAGAAALLMERHPRLSPGEVKSLLEHHAHHPEGPGRPDNRFGYGRIDVWSALGGDPAFNNYASLGIQLRDAAGDFIDTSKYPNLEDPSSSNAFFISVRLEADDGNILGPVRVNDLGEAWFPHVPAGLPYTAVATAQNLHGETVTVSQRIEPLAVRENRWVEMVLDIARWAPSL